MFTNYKIVGDTLYLYVDYSCEIGSIFDKEKNYNLIDKVNKYIKDRKIKFNGIKVVLLLSGLMLGTIYLNKPNDKTYDTYKDNKYVYNIVDKTIPEITTLEDEEVSNEVTKVVEDAINTTHNKSEVGTNNKVVSKNNTPVIATNINSNTSQANLEINNNSAERYVTLKRNNGSIVTLSMTDYLIGVVSAEMPASFNIEALKAQSVVARTYTYKLLEYGRVLTDDISTQVYKDNNELKTLWGNDYYKYYEKITSAIKSTNEEVIKYDGALIDAVYHSTSNGYTENSEDSKKAASILELELSQAKTYLGLTDVIGEGIIVTLTDNDSMPEDDLEIYDRRISVYDLLQLVNELKLAGAEAISINGQRLIDISEIRCAGPTLSVNNVRSSAPYEIHAIGDKKTLENAIKMRGGVSDTLKVWGIQLEVETSNTVDIPPYKGTHPHIYGHPVEEKY